MTAKTSRPLTREPRPGRRSVSWVSFEGALDEAVRLYWQRRPVRRVAP